MSKKSSKTSDLSPSPAGSDGSVAIEKREVTEGHDDHGGGEEREEEDQQLVPTQHRRRHAEHYRNVAPRLLLHCFMPDRHQVVVVIVDGVGLHLRGP